MPFKLYIKIQDFLVKKSYKKANKKSEIKNLVNNLPEQLRNEMLLIINKDIIDNFIIFKDCKNTDFIIKIISCFTQTICRKESILIKEGDPVENIIVFTFFDLLSYLYRRTKNTKLDDSYQYSR